MKQSSRAVAFLAQQAERVGAPTDPVISPLAVKPSRACIMLDIGVTRLYELLNAGQLESYKDGRSRKITVASINAYVARRLKENQQSEAPAA